MARRKLTKDEAIAKLIETGKLSTDLLEPLGFSFESFLKLAQLPKEQAAKVVSDLIAYYQADSKGKAQIIAQAFEDLSNKGN